MNSYADEITQSTKILKKFMNNQELFGRERDMLEFCKTRYDLYYSEIHENLAKKKTKVAENKIQDYIKDIFAYDFQICSTKIKRFETAIKYYQRKKEQENEILSYQFLREWLLLYENNYALVAFRSLEHFAMFVEWDKNEEDKMWKYSIDTFGDSGWSGCTKGFFYYANKMVLSNEVNFIEKQLPTNYGKCVHKDTLVRTPNGIKKICDIKVGDFVYSMKNNEIVERKILNRWDTHKQQVKITTNCGNEIIVSKEHKLLTQKGYLQAQEITENDYLYRLCGKIDNGIEQNNDELAFVFEKIKKIEYLEEYADMVDIEVEETHNFIANDIISHNSYSDSIMISFILGIDKNEQIVKVVGNKSLPSKCTTQVVNIMASKRFLQVFPEYAELYNGEGEIKDSIFSICRIADGLLTVKGSAKDTNYECFSKDTKRDGIRCGYLFLDDIVQAKEILKFSSHIDDLNAFDSSWKKRCRDEYNFKIVVGGTTYDAYDLLCTLKSRYSNGKLLQSKVNKWTYTNEQGNSVFIVVPKLDENDKLTFPQKCKLESVLEDRKNNPEIFSAMDMQKPIIPKEFAFYWDYLLQYEYIPSTCTEYAQATLDPARTGDNYVSMPICRINKELDENGKEIEMNYVVGALYKKMPMDLAFPLICSNVEAFHIVKLHVETNTNSTIKSTIEKMLHERNIFFCEVSEVYSTKNKEERIYANENVIKNKFRYPKRDMYAPNSDLGLFMQHIISYKYKGSEYDDSIDSLGMYCDKFINNKNKNGKAKLLYV